MSMTMAGLARLGNDPTVRRMADNKAVMDLSLAFSFGRKVDGKQPVTWISATMWGDRCDKLKPYLTKGQLLFVTLTEIHIEEYKPQMLLQSACTGKDVWFVSYDPRMGEGKDLFVKKYRPTPEEIAEVEKAAEQFLAECDALFDFFNNNAVYIDKD